MQRERIWQVRPIERRTQRNRILPIDGSTLSLNFTTMGSTLDPRITFSRADATALATFVNSSGYVTTVSTAQAPRFDFDPTTLAAKGLLLEAPATNLHTYSIGLSQNPWFAVTNVVRTNSTGGTAPDGTNNTASRLGLSAAIGASSALYYNGVTVTNQKYTHSLYAKADTTDWLYLWIETSGSVAFGAYFNLTGSGSVGNLVGSGTTANITPYPNGWYRCETTSTQSGTTYPCILPSTGNLTGRASMIGTTPGNVLVWGDQFEAGSGASSYIPTVASTVTRAVDTAIIAAGSNFSSWYKGGTKGTFVANWYGSASTTTARSVIATSDVDDQHLHMYQTPSALTLRLADYTALATVTTGNSLTAGALAKGAFSYASTATSLCLNGGTVVTGTLGFSVAPTFLSIGGPSTTGTTITDTASMLNNSIRTLKYFPMRLSDSQIQSLTT
jgi:hypothetical protein